MPKKLKTINDVKLLISVWMRSCYDCGFHEGDCERYIKKSLEEIIPEIKNIFDQLKNDESIIKDNEFYGEIDIEIEKREKQLREKIDLFFK